MSLLHRPFPSLGSSSVSITLDSVIELVVLQRAFPGISLVRRGEIVEQIGGGVVVTIVSQGRSQGVVRVGATRNKFVNNLKVKQIKVK